MLPVEVAIREVGPRDGFQNEPEVIATDDKVRLIDEHSGTAAITPAEVARFRPIRDAIRDRFDALIPPDTAIVMPVTACPALRIDAPPQTIGDFYRRTLTLTSVAGHCGAPQVTLPLGRRRGCPIGLSVLGRRGSDRALLELAVTLAARVAESTPA